MIRSGGGPWRSTGAPARLIQNVVNPNAFAPIASQPFDDTKPIRPAGTLQPVDGELVDARARLVDAGGIDREDAVEMRRRGRGAAPAAPASPGFRSTGSSAGAAQAPPASPARPETARASDRRRARRAALAPRAAVRARRARNRAHAPSPPRSPRGTDGPMRLCNHVYSSCFVRHSRDSTAPRPGTSFSARRDDRMHVEQACHRHRTRTASTATAEFVMGNGMLRRAPRRAKKEGLHLRVTPWFIWWAILGSNQ